MRKCSAVILSCTTEEQLGVAKVYADLLMAKRKGRATSIIDTMYWNADRAVISYIIETQRKYIAGDPMMRSMCGAIRDLAE